MRRALLITVFLLLPTGRALAEPAAMPEEPRAAEPAPPPPPPPTPRVVVPLAPLGEHVVGPDGRPVAVGQRRGKGSGFWGSDTPAPDGRPYRWEHMAIGLGVAAAMGGLIIYLIRRHGRRASA